MKIKFHLPTLTHMTMGEIMSLSTTSFMHAVKIESTLCIVLKNESHSMAIMMENDNILSLVFYRQLNDISAYDTLLVVDDKLILPPTADMMWCSPIQRAITSITDEEKKLSLKEYQTHIMKKILTIE